MNQRQLHQRNGRRQDARQGFMKGIVGGIAGGLITTAVIGGVLLGSGVIRFNTSSAPEQAASSLTSSTAESQSSATSTAAKTPTITAVETVQDAVVSVINRQENTSEQGFFSQSATDQYDTLGEGSGVIYKVAGDAAYIVTNRHVIEGADDIEVILRAGTVLKAELIGEDIWTDLAVLKVSSADVTAVAKFANSDNVVVGEQVIAIGSPISRDFATTVTQGIVSGKERSLSVDLNNDGENDWTMTVVQTDAAINPGNSGGALVNLQAEVIGINSMKISNTQIEGLGFAIPSNEVVKIIADLENQGQVVRPFLGVSMENISTLSTRDRRQVLRLPSTVDEGVIITRVVENNGVTDKVLERYDVIVAWNGTPVSDTISLRKMLYSQKVGDTVSLTVYRDGVEQTVEVELGSSAQTP